jgi:hypothetical protein
LECPQAHHQYTPGSAGCTKGNFWNTMGSLIITYFDANPRLAQMKICPSPVPVMDTYAGRGLK